MDLLSCVCPCSIGVLGVNVRRSISQTVCSINRNRISVGLITSNQIKHAIAPKTPKHQAVLCRGSVIKAKTPHRRLANYAVDCGHPDPITDLLQKSGLVESYNQRPDTKLLGYHVSEDFCYNNRTSWIFWRVKRETRQCTVTLPTTHCRGVPSSTSRFRKDEYFGSCSPYCCVPRENTGRSHARLKDIQ